MIVGYAFVVGDLLHYGHVRFLKRCKDFCDYLIVGVYTDELTSTYKRKPIMSYNERVEVIRALECVDKVIKVKHKDTTPALKRLVAAEYNVKYLFHGDDWKEVAGKEYIESIGGKLIQFPYIEGISTTDIIERMKEYDAGDT